LLQDSQILSSKLFNLFEYLFFLLHSFLNSFESWSHFRLLFFKSSFLLSVKICSSLTGRYFSFKGLQLSYKLFDLSFLFSPKTFDVELGLKLFI
jgi:hypothetical protein